MAMYYNAVNLLYDLRILLIIAHHVTANLNIDLTYDFYLNIFISAATANDIDPTLKKLFRYAFIH
jgi:hypothetical protein